VYQASLKGGPVCFRQKKDGSDEIMRGQALRVEYDQKLEKVEFFNSVIVHDGANEMRGDYVVYYMNTEKFEVRDKPGAAARLVLVPREKEEPDEAVVAQAAAKEPAKPRLKTSKEIEMGRHEPLASKCVKEAL
jgi:lipopolysaccharide export system protein LptA